MNDVQYRAEIEKVKSGFIAVAKGNGVGVIVPAAMEMVLNCVLSIDDKQAALAATQSLRPMIDYIEGQIKGLH